jgi:hypothetical protein
MADFNAVLNDLKRTIADLTVDNAILRADLAEKDAWINERKAEDLSSVSEKEETPDGV